jgi:Polysaccharide pyruvyl transferase
VKTVLLLGSYTGQDSFGDICLLRSVTTQFQTIFGPDVRSVCDIEENLEKAREVVPGGQITEISRLFSEWLNRLRRWYIPFSLQMIITVLIFPIWLMVEAESRLVFRCLLDEVRSCSCLYFYGGTQLSEQWFGINFPTVFFLTALCRLFGKPVYWGPQQYGPESSWQRRWVRFTIRFLATDVAARSANCVRLLALPESRLFYDEIFSCTARYRICPKRDRRPTFILINMRASNFLRDATVAEYHAFGQLLDRLHERLGLPFKLFQMSGSSFCDDQQLKGFLDRNGFGHIPVEILPPLDQEQELIDLAADAYGTVSMSFHGCIFSMIGGCPAVPITSGRYYDYKYADFDRYAGGQHVPIVSLQDLAPEHAVDDIVEYFKRYEPARSAAARERAAAQVGNWYLQIRNHVKNEAYEQEAYNLSEMMQ